MSRPKRNRFIAWIALLLLAALACSCARTAPTTEVAEDAGKKKEKPAANAADVDRALAEAATEALGDREGAVLVMDPHTGRLRAVVNPRLAFEQAFPPGSTIKSFTALTAMRAGLIDRESRTLCRGRFTSDGLDVVCSHPKSKAPFNLGQALGYSCNYFFATLSGRLSFDAFKATLASAGLGAKTGVNAGGESAGTLRDGDWRVRDLLGEGDNLLVTPIQLLTAYCALMNGGHVFRPQLSDVEKFVGEERANLHIEDSNRAALIEGMRAAVVYGTAEKARLSSLPIFIFGKTGTSTSSNGFRRQGWFASFAADANSPAEATPESLELAVLVFIKRSHGSDAAVVSHRVFEEYVKRRGGEEARAIEGETGRRGEGETGRGGEGTTLRVKILSENRVVTIPLEEYVTGVLSVEAAVEDEIEALKAQAIVTRSYALKNLGRHASEGFDLCSNTHCQQYVDDASRVSETMRRAVTDTAGEVLLDANGQPADAYFHAACGGYTANFESLWGTPGPSYLRGIRDDYCATMPNHNWTDEIPAAQLAKALASDPLTDAGRKIDDIIVTKTDATGRAEIISIEGERRRQIRGWDFKLIVGRALGWNVLKSSRFSVSRRGASFVFRGSGFGHGLGLCQNGAHVIARRGGTSGQILNKYFPRVRISAEPINAKAQSRQGAVLETETDSSPSASLRLCALALAARQSLSSEHFHISYPVRTPRSDIEAALRLLEAARLDMFALVGPAPLSLPIDVVVHETTQDFMAATGQSWWVAGVTHGRRIELQPLAVLRRRRRILGTTLRHEYAHVVIEAVGGNGAPRWLTEGMAIGFAGEGPMLLRFSSKTRLPLDELEWRLAHPRSSAEMRSLYAAAYREVRALISKEGEPAVWRRLGARAHSALSIHLRKRALAGLFLLESPIQNQEKRMSESATATGSSGEPLFEAFLNQHDDKAWSEIVDTLLPSIHEVDRTATEIWFYFFPLAILRALEQAEDPERLKTKLSLAGNYLLRDQVDSSHQFLYGHRYWPQVKAAVSQLAASANAPASLDLATQILDVAARVANRLNVDASLVTGITAVAFQTLQQAGAAAFNASPGATARYSSKSPEEILRERARDDRQGLFSFLRPDKIFTVTFRENDPDARFTLINTQHLTTAAANDKRDHHSRDPRCVVGEGPIPIECRSAACGTCWVGVLGGSEKLSEVTALEWQKIKDFGYIDTDDPRPLIRLACQAQAYGNVSIVIPPWNGVFGKFIRAQQYASDEEQQSSAI